MKTDNIKTNGTNNIKVNNLKTSDIKTSDIKIKIIENHDNDVIDQIIRIDKEAFQEGGLSVWTLVPLIRFGRVMALYEGEKIIGGVQFLRDWKDFSKAYVYGIALDSEKRGQGLGTIFLRECLNILYDEGVKMVELTVSPGNKSALRVYKDKLGFKITGQRKDEFGPGQDRLVMVRELPVT